MTALDPQKTLDQLARIADVLGIPVSSFLTDSVATSDITSTREMLQLWLALESMDDRLALLRAARAAVAKQAA